MSRKGRGVRVAGMEEANAPPAGPEPELVAAEEDSAPSAAPEPQRVVVTLAKPHTHQGRDYAIGDQLTVTPPIAEWLRQQRVIDSDPA